MAAIQHILFFRGQRFGDVVKMEPDNLVLTPPVAQVGLFQSVAGLNSDSVNMQYGLVVTIHLTRYTIFDFTQDAAAIQRLQGLRGNLEIKEVVPDPPLEVVRILGENWILAFVPRPAIAEGHGGRLVQSWPLRFVGDSSLQHFV